MTGVVKEIDGIVIHLDTVLSKGRLKRSVRRDLERVRDELIGARETANLQGSLRAAGWILQIGSLIARISEILSKHHH